MGERGVGSRWVDGMEKGEWEIRGMEGTVKRNLLEIHLTADNDRMFRARKLVHLCYRETEVSKIMNTISGGCLYEEGGSGIRTSSRLIASILLYTSFQDPHHHHQKGRVRL